ncbi:hypothetical protein AB1Y20_013838 [Prymnesium parvum]|uniref:Uncharacterized protein n=1 Tax=Prymnesium parvum TaxID=97485 RepID=A0AB34IGX9_PRYPA
MASPPARPAAASTPPSAGLRQRRASQKESDDKRIHSMLAAAATASPPPLAAYLRHASPLVDPSLQLLAAVGPFYLRLASLSLALYRSLPLDAIELLLGLALCFCGGAYGASLAAIEAFSLVGYEATGAAIADICDEVGAVRLAVAADAPRAHAGSAVDQLKHKATLAALAVRDPQKLTHAVAALYAAWVVVQGTLRLQERFAKSITIGVSVAKMLDPLALRFGLPVLLHILPPELHHWLPTAVRVVCKLIAISFAWYLQAIIFAVQSSIKGGLLFGRKALALAHKHGYIHRSQVEDSYLDETIGFTVALFGFYSQWQWGFSLPFPVNIIMLPFSIIEWYIRWSISS